MTDLMKLSDDLTAEDFFLETLPEALSEVDLPDGLGPERMQFNVVGDEGIEIHIGLDDDGDLTIEEGQAGSPPIAITLSVDDFLSIITGDLRDQIDEATGGKVRIGPRQLRHTFMPDDQVQKIKKLSGDIQVRIEDTDTGDETVVTVTLGGGAPNTESPACIVRLNVPTLLEAASGRQNPQNLFMQGLLRIDGEMSIVLELMGALQAG